MTTPKLQLQSGIAETKKHLSGIVARAAVENFAVAITNRKHPLVVMVPWSYWVSLQQQERQEEAA